MMQADEPDDYVIATGEAHSVREFLDEAFGYVGLDWEPHVRRGPALLPAGRPADPRGRSSKARRPARWEPKVSFTELVRSMVDAELVATGLSIPVP